MGFGGRRAFRSLGMGFEPLNPKFRYSGCEAYTFLSLPSRERESFKLIIIGFRALGLYLGVLGY